MSAKKVSTEDIRQKIIAGYMDYVLEQEAIPGSVYKFCKIANIEEKLFYNHFSSLKGIQKGIWEYFHEHTTDLLSKQSKKEAIEGKTAMLSYFFTFFELLTLNRSYVLFALQEGDLRMDVLKQLDGLRIAFQAYAESLTPGCNLPMSESVMKARRKSFAKGAWLQFLFLMRFWIKDESPGFEKTDMAIEKSVVLAFEIIDPSTVEKAFDFGKFLVKEMRA